MCPQHSSHRGPLRTEDGPCYSAAQSRPVAVSWSQSQISDGGIQGPTISGPAAQRPSPPNHLPSTCFLTAFQHTAFLLFLKHNSHFLSRDLPDMHCFCLESCSSKCLYGLRPLSASCCYNNATQLKHPLTFSEKAVYIECSPPFPLPA